MRDCGWLHWSVPFLEAVQDLLEGRWKDHGVRGRAYPITSPSSDRLEVRQWQAKSDASGLFEAMAQAFELASPLGNQISWASWVILALFLAIVDTFILSNIPDAK